MDTETISPERAREIERVAGEIFNRRRIKGDDREYAQLKRSASALLNAAAQCQLDLQFIQQIQMIRSLIFNGRAVHGLRLVAARKES